MNTKTMTATDLKAIAQAVAETRPDSPMKQFPGGPGGMVAALLFIFMTGGAIFTVIAGIIVSIFGFIAAHFFGQFTDLTTNVNSLSADFRQLQAEVRSSNDGYQELKDANKELKVASLNRHTQVDDQRAQQQDERAREYLRREILQAIEAVAGAVDKVNREAADLDDWRTGIEERERKQDSSIERMWDQIRILQGTREEE